MDSLGCRCDKSSVERLSRSVKDDGVHREVDDGAATEAMLPGLRATMEPANPGMHRSDTVDFVYVLEGEVVLELDHGCETTLRAGDTLVQNGTRHAWRNRSGQPCRMLVVMLGAVRANGS
jgi:uncharacterized cupin superfamily protein